MCCLGQVNSPTLALNNQVLLRSQFDKWSLFGRREINYDLLGVTFFTILKTQHTETSVFISCGPIPCGLFMMSSMWIRKIQFQTLTSCHIHLFKVLSICCRFSYIENTKMKKLKLLTVKHLIFWMNELVFPDWCYI